MVKSISIMLLTLSLSLPVMATSTKIYVWRNDDGVLVFSDSPKPGAEEVTIENKNDQITSVDTSILDIKPKIIEEKYQVTINQPENNSTVRDNTGSVYVSGRIKPIFKQGLKIQLYLDNNPYEEPQTHSMFVLRNIDRGEHKIKMKLLNNEGKVIASSSSIIFYMHRASSLNSN